MPFYHPIYFQEGIPTIIYPERDTERLLKNLNSIKTHIAKIKGLGIGNKIKINYHIGFLWAQGEKLMTDFWSFSGNWNSGPLAFVNVFQDYAELDRNKIGIASGNTLRVLGLEEMLRKKYYGKIDDYLNGPRPKLPKYLTVGEKF